MAYELTQGAFTFSDDAARLDFAAIHHYLAHESYWAVGRSRETVEKSFARSHPFGVYEAGRQIGWARVVTDYTTFAWLADVYILPDYRRRGLSKQLMAFIIAHPELQKMRRWVLATKDAHELYRQYGFREMVYPERWMERPAPDAYPA
jgi:GNAT superfamily N-acetyltransferase